MSCAISNAVAPALDRWREWKCASAAVAGARHVARGETCQDAAVARHRPRPYCIVADGKGSSPVSQQGATAAVKRMAAILRLLDPVVADVLDGDAALDQDRRWRAIAEVFCCSLGEELVRLAREFKRPPADYEFTLAAAIVGRRRLGWLCVGDSVLVAEVGGVLGLLAAPYNGEFANHTVFVRPGRVPEGHLESGLLPIADLRGIVACSDGTAFHFVEAATLVPTSAFREVFGAVARGGCDSAALATFLAAPRWAECHGDDRAMAILADAERPPDADQAATSDASPMTNTAGATSALSIGDTVAPGT